MRNIFILLFIFFLNLTNVEASLRIKRINRYLKDCSKFCYTTFLPGDSLLAVDSYYWKRGDGNIVYTTDLEAVTPIWGKY